MVLVTCPDCNGKVSDAAPACIHCGRPMAAAVQGTDVPASSGYEGSYGGQTSDEPTSGGSSMPEIEYPFFPVSTGKFVSMAICTLGIYELYWCYKNWKRIRARTGEALSPFWRAFFAPLWGFALFRQIRDHQEGLGTSVSWSAGALGTLYLVLNIAWRLPDPWWLISLGTFLPILPVLRTTQEVNSAVISEEDANTSFTPGNVAVLVVGGLLCLLAVVGTLMPG